MQNSLGEFRYFKEILQRKTTGKLFQSYYYRLSDLSIRWKGQPFPTVFDLLETLRLLFG